jgi:hypothetical protein
MVGRYSVPLADLPARRFHRFPRDLHEVTGNQHHLVVPIVDHQGLRMQVIMNAIRHARVIVALQWNIQERRDCCTCNPDLQA